MFRKSFCLLLHIVHQLFEILHYVPLLMSTPIAVEHIPKPMRHLDKTGQMVHV